jgi:hypothetical protein
MFFVPINSIEKYLIGVHVKKKDQCAQDAQ